MRTFEYAPRYYILVHSLARGLPSIARFIVGIMPIFLGYAFAATIFFGRTSASFIN
eukprot:SAG11_NODE_6240_length_1355_cov_1.588376_1_plen_55_part_10